MVDFEALYSAPHPGRALLAWALEPCRRPAVPAAPPVRTCPTCQKPLAPHNRSGYCAAHAGPVYNARYFARRKSAPAPPAASAPDAELPPPLSNYDRQLASAALITAVAAAPPLAPGLPEVCTASPTGGHRMLPFGGLALPGQRTHYCAYCQPRGTAHKTDFFGGSIR